MTPLPSLEEAEAAQASQHPHLPSPRRHCLRYVIVELIHSKSRDFEGACLYRTALYGTTHLLVHLMGSMPAVGKHPAGSA